MYRLFETFEWMKRGILQRLIVDFAFADNTFGSIELELLEVPVWLHGHIDILELKLHQELEYIERSSFARIDGPGSIVELGCDDTCRVFVSYSSGGLLASDFDWEHPKKRRYLRGLGLIVADIGCRRVRLL